MKGTLLVAFLVAAATASRALAGGPQVAHMVFFTLKKDTPENRQALIRACHKYLTGHKGTVYYSAGAIAGDFRRDVNDRAFHVALHLVFADKEAHDTYQNHPRHLEFIKRNKHLWSKVRVFDSYLDPPPRK